MSSGYLASRAGALSLVLCLLNVGASIAHAQAAAPAISADDEEKARAHFRLGRAHYDNGDFAQAAVEFESAYRISQRSALLYNIYLAYRDASDTRHAAEALRKYLLLEQKVENRGQLESRLAALDRSLADGTAPTPATQTAAAAPLPKPADSSQPSTLQPIAAQPTGVAASEVPAPTGAVASSDAAPAGQSTNLLPIVLMGGGGAMVAASIITGVMTLGKKGELSDAQDKCTKENNCQSLTPARVTELKNAQSSGKTLALVTDLLLFGGLAVGGTGAVLFLLNRGNERQSAPATTAALACAPGACMGSFSTRF